VTAGSIVVNADDLGVARGATLGIVEAHRNGCVTSASLTVTTPFYQHAVDSCVRPYPALGIGLHFTLTSGKPVSAPDRVPLLVDERGLFRWRFTSLFRAMAGGGNQALAAQIEIELEAQLARLLTDGIRPDHIDGERHVQLIPGIFELVVAAAQRHRVPFVRAGAEIGAEFLTGGHLARIVLTGGPVKSWLLSRLTRQAQAHLVPAVRTADSVASYLYTGRMDLIMARLLAGAPRAGITEVMVHPGIPEESGGIDLGNREIERYMMDADRRRELDACVAYRAARERLRLTTFAQLAVEGVA
jgi:predicted glycoside hydrolase/deacetylase ChbG (UPF0249 family)